MKGKIICLTIIFLISAFCCNLKAQTKQPSSMKYGESVSYDVYFKWGLIMPRAGEAVFSYNKNSAVANATSCYQMLFKTTKFFDNFFKMRDTMACYYDNYNKLIYSQKNSDEGDYYLIDKLTFNYGEENAHIKSLRYTPSKVKIDTTLIATGYITDLLGAIFYLRGIDRSKLQSGNTYPFTVAIGKDLIKIQFRYENQTVVERGNMKYNTRYFKIDIYDVAFENTKAAAEVWVGDDDNFLPVKVRSKLKIGYAEIYYKTSSGLAHPLTSHIEVK